MAKCHKVNQYLKKLLWIAKLVIALGLFVKAVAITDFKIHQNFFNNHIIFLVVIDRSKYLDDNDVSNYLWPSSQWRKHIERLTSDVRGARCWSSRKKKFPRVQLRLMTLGITGAPAQCRKWAKQGTEKISIHCLCFTTGPCYLPKILTYSLLDPS